MALNPVLQGGIGYEAGVVAPSAGGTAANLVSGLIGGMPKRTTAAKPTADEKFAADWKKYSGAVGVALSVDNPNFDNNLQKYAPDFLRRYPQHTDSFKAFSGGFGIDTLGSVETRSQQAQDDAFISWSATPAGILANVEARDKAMVGGQFDKAVYEKAMVEAYGEELELTAQLDEVEKRKSLVSSATELSDGLWNAYQPTAVRRANSAMNIMSDVLMEVQKNGSAALPPELQQQFGVEKIDSSNAYLIAAQWRQNLVQTMRSELTGRSNQNVQSPSDAYLNEVFSGYDLVVKTMKEDFGNTSAMVQFAQNRSTIEAINHMNKVAPGIFNKVSVINLIDNPAFGHLLSTTLASNEGFMAQFGSLIASLDSTTPDLVQIQSNLSAPEREELTTTAVESLSMGQGGNNLKNYSVILFQGIGSTRYMSEDVWDQTIGKNRAGLNELLTTDSDFAQFFEKNMLDDLSKQFTEIRKKYDAPGIRIYLDENNKIGFEFNRAAMVAGGDFTEENVDSAIADIKASGPLPGTENAFKAFNKKMLALENDFGKSGKKITEAMRLSNAPKQTKPESMDKKGELKGSAGDDTLGLDFGKYEQEYGLPSGYLSKVAQIESGGDPSAKNPKSSAGGLFQQIDSNAKQYGVKNRFDPVQSTIGASKFARDNTVYLTKHLGRAPTGGELYLAHQQGPEGARKLLSNPDAKAVDVVGVKQVQLNGGHPDMTAQEFANLWINKYNGSSGATVSGTYTYKEEATPEEVAKVTANLGDVGVTTTTTNTGSTTGGAVLTGEGASEVVIGESTGEGSEAAQEAARLALEGLSVEARQYLKALLGE